MRLVKLRLRPSSVRGPASALALAAVASVLATASSAVYTEYGVAAGTELASSVQVVITGSVTTDTESVGVTTSYPDISVGTQVVLTEAPAHATPAEGGLMVSRRVDLELAAQPAGTITFPSSDLASYSYEIRNRSNDTVRLGFGFRRPGSVPAGTFDPYQAFAAGGTVPTFEVNGSTDVSWPAASAQGDAFGAWVGASSGLDVAPGDTVTIAGNLAAPPGAAAGETATLEFAARILQPSAWLSDPTVTEGANLLISDTLSSEPTLADPVRTVAASALTQQTDGGSPALTVAELRFSSSLELTAPTAELVSYVRRTGPIGETACTDTNSAAPAEFPMTNRALELEGTLGQDAAPDVLNAPLVPGTCVEYALRIVHTRTDSGPSGMQVVLDVPMPVRVLGTYLAEAFAGAGGVTTTEADRGEPASACGTEAGDVCRVTVSGLALSASVDGTPVIGEVRVRGYVD